jgi:hypothetical protein
MLIKIPEYEILRRETDIWNPSLNSPAWNLAAAAFPPLGLAALTQSETSGHCTARSVSAALRVRRDYWN